MRLLWTGFEPFGEHDYNPSWDVARAASQSSGRFFPSESERLPVTYHAVREWVSESLDTDEARIVVQIGLAESRTTIGLESRAYNSPGERLDERGERGGVDGRLVADGPDLRETTFPLDDLRDELRTRRSRDESLPDVALSDDAGRYVCNALYFHSIGACTEGQNVAFVHVPKMGPTLAERLGERLGHVVAEVMGGRETPVE